jgi:hypothetical protein
MHPKTSSCSEEPLCATLSAPLNRSGKCNFRQKAQQCSTRVTVACAPFSKNHLTSEIHLDFLASFLVLLHKNGGTSVELECVPHQCSTVRCCTVLDHHWNNAFEQKILTLNYRGDGACG